MASRRRLLLRDSWPGTTIAATLGCYLAYLWLLAGSVYALDPHKHVTQYIHTSWRVRDGSAPGSPGNLRFTHLSVADGLSHADVRAIAQDHQGFMWFGTWLGGLNRYDGYTFKVYEHDDQDERSLNNDTVRTLFVDHTGVLWISTMGPGLERYDRDTDSFTHYRHDPHDADSLPDNNVKAFFEDETGTLWVGTHAGLSRFDRSRGKFFTYRARPDDPASLGETHVQSIGLDVNTGLLWVGTEDDGVRVLDRSTGHFTSYAHDPNDPGSLGVGRVNHIFQDRAGTMWLSTPFGLNRFDSRTHTFLRYTHDPRNLDSLGDSAVLETYEDRAGRFWVATNTGLDLMDRARGTFAHFAHNPSDPSSVSSNILNYEALCEDTSGALWIGTRSTGVDRLVSEPPRFTTYRHNSQDDKSLGNNAVNGLAIDSGGEMWIGTETGLDRFDGKTFSHYNPNDPSSLSPGPQRVVAQDARGVVWTASYGGGLDRLDGQRFTHFRHDPKNPDSLADDAISSLVPDPKKGLWIGVHGKGLDYFDGQHFTHFTPEPKNPAGLPTHLVTPVLLDQSGVLWIATSDMGLVRFDTNSRKFTTYLMDPAQPGSQAANWTEDVYSDGASIWVAASTGLFRFDPETGRFTRHYTERDGLPNNSVVGILGDARGNLWLSTVRGLSKFDPKAETFRNYDEFDGLQGDQFTILSRAKAPDGRLFFGGPNGLSAFYPDRLVDNPTPPPVLLTEFELSNKPVKIGGKDSPLRQAINVASSLTLRYGQSVFRFQFAALDFTAPQKNRYAYRLEGFDRDWQYTDATRRFATYTHLDPGDYTFRVKASNNDGVWNEQGVALHIRILPPWWNTWWFRALYAAIFLALLWVAYQLRVHQLQRESKQLRDVIDTIPGYVWSALPEGSIDFINRRWLEFSGLSLEEGLGRGWEAAVHPDDLARFVDEWRAAVASGKAMESEARVRGADGQYRWLLIRNVPLHDERGKIVKWYGTSTDIEDRKQAENALRQAQADLAHVTRIMTMGELAASIAHEVNQPLSGVVVNGNACLRWLAGESPNLEEAREAVQRIVRDGKRAGDVIARIRALATKTAPAKERLDMNEAIREVIALAGDEVRKNRVAVRTEFAPDLLPVAGDRVQLQQVVLNLVMNGVEAMSRVEERPRELIVRTQNDDGGQVRVTVQDSGMGLDPQSMERMFEAFYTTKPGGMGMGLSISRSIIQNHGGKLWAEANDGPGISVQFTIPKYQQ
jgi:PAS domain S-box-containing protein